ncbi:MAG: MoaD/ThiS family protein [Acidobacteriota bacterium]|nr:MoaD/ThiS family protein [Acidobacteriota bacterium]
MQYQVKLFALLKERAGSASWSCQSDEALTGSQLLAAFFDAHPSLNGLRTVTRLAVNQAFCEGDPVLAEGDELALIPPVSGG